MHLTLHCTLAAQPPHHDKPRSPNPEHQHHHGEPGAAGAERAGSDGVDSERDEDITVFCVQIAEVEVDTETGHVHLTKFTSAHDVGTILNPLGHQSQIDGTVGNFVCPFQGRPTENCLDWSWSVSGTQESPTELSKHSGSL